MKQLKKAVVMAVLAVTMFFASQLEAKAWTVLNATPETMVFGKGYEIKSLDFGKCYQYKMHVPQSGMVSFSVDSNGSTYHQIFEASDIKYENHLVEGSHKNGLSNHNYYLLAGDYIVHFVNRRSNLSFVAQFTSSGETKSESYRESNNMVGTATSYTIGQKVKALLAVNDDRDIYKLKVEKPGYLTINCNSDLQSVNMQLVSEVEGVCYNQYGIPVGVSKYKYFVPKGTYYLSFLRKSTDGFYTFSVEHSLMSVSKVKRATNLKGEKVKISWSKKSDVDGYQVQVALNKKFTKGKKSKTLAVTTGWYGKNPTNHTFAKLKKGKYYYARVRTYKLCNGKKCYSDWSSVKKFKVKK